jgi:hypothetical protein
MVKWGVLGRDHLERVIPIAQTRALGDTEVTLISVEVYNGGFVLNHRIRSLGAKEDQRQAFHSWFSKQEIPRSTSPDIGFPEVTWQASDDQESNYTSVPEGSGGSAADYSGSTAFLPTLSKEATRLVISLDEVRWMPVNRRQRSRVDPGPWRFEVPLT